MSADILGMWKSASRATAQLRGLLQVANSMNHNQPEQDNETIVAILRVDALAQKMLLDELAVLEKGQTDLRAAIAEKRE